MITVKVDSVEMFNNETNEFIVVDGAVLRLEHSLASISKWEGIWKKPFLSKPPANNDELFSYFRCMCLNEDADDIDDNVFKSISSEDLKRIMDYIEDTKTATWFSDKNGKKHRGKNIVMTSEIIYWEMTQFGIPFECENWHLNRLLTLIRVCDEKGQPPKKMDQNALLRQYAGVNAKRRPRKH